MISDSLSSSPTETTTDCNRTATCRIRISIDKFDYRIIKNDIGGERSSGGCVQKLEGNSGQLRKGREHLLRIRSNHSKRELDVSRTQRLGSERLRTYEPSPVRGPCRRLRSIDYGGESTVRNSPSWTNCATRVTLHNKFRRVIVEPDLPAIERETAWKGCRTYRMRTSNHCA